MTSLARHGVGAGHLHRPWHQYPRMRWSLWAILAMVGVLGIGGYQPEALALSITLDTTALAGTDARLEFDLIDGDGADNNSATIAGLATDGTLLATDCTVSCTGGPPFTISDTGGLGQFLQDLQLGNVIALNLTFTTNFAGVPGAPDRFLVSLLDSGTNFTLVDTNLDLLNDPVPVQDALLFVDFVGAPQGITIQVATQTTPNVGVQVVPEPSTLALLTLGLPLLYWWRRRALQRA